MMRNIVSLFIYQIFMIFTMIALSDTEPEDYENTG